MILAIHREFCTQGHREVDHFQTFGDDDGFALEACTPMTSGRMLALNGFRPTCAHNQRPFRNDRTRDLRGLRTIDVYLPLLESRGQLLDGALLAMAAFPVQPWSGITIKSCPDPACSRVFLRSGPMSSTASITPVPSGAGCSSGSRAYSRTPWRTDGVDP